MKDVGGDFIVNKLSELQTTENKKVTPKDYPQKKLL